VYDIDNERRIILIADTHQGARVGLWYPIQDDSNCWIYPSDVQLRLLEYWYDMWHEAEKWGYDTIMLAGDLANGNERKEFGRGVTTANLTEQVASCVAMLGPHCVGKRVHGIQGSPYHQALETSLDEMIVKGVGGTWHGKLGIVQLEGPEKIVFMAHGDSASLIYRETDCARESIYMDAIEPRLGYHIDIVVRGHWHWYYAGQNRSRHFVQAPGWKLWFPWKSKLWAKMLPDLGAVFIRVTKRSITVEPMLYPYVPVYDAVTRG